jgi:hypothetical protein
VITSTAVRCCDNCGSVISKTDTPDRLAHGDFTIRIEVANNPQLRQQFGGDRTHDACCARCAIAVLQKTIEEIEKNRSAR